MRTKIHRIAICGAAALMTGFGLYSWAQNSGGSPNMMGGYGPGMMSGPGDYPHGMMDGYGPNYQQTGNGKSVLANRLDVIKQKLKITSEQAPAWQTYADSVTATDQTLKSSMRSAIQSGASPSMTPDSRFARAT